MKTAKEFIEEILLICYDFEPEDWKGDNEVRDTIGNVEKVMNEFARLHVEAALKEASEKADAKADNSDSLRVSRKIFFGLTEATLVM